MSTDWSAPRNIPTNVDDNDDDNDHKGKSSILHRIRFRDARPTDIPICFALEQESYPPDEAATRSRFQYRQHHAASFFRCAVLFEDAQKAAAGDDDDDTTGTAATTAVIGFVNATRCRVFTHHSMTTHISGGPLLAIHSVVVQEQYRRQGIATAMLQDYVETVHERQDERMLVRSIVLMAKADLLPFYVKAGFSVIRPSPIVHGSEPWYELELDMMRYESKIAAATATLSSPTNTMTVRRHLTKHCVPCFIVDAFVEPHHPAGTGNQAAVVLCENVGMMMPEEVDEDELMLEWMQTVAAEFNLSETAFVWQLHTPTAAAATTATAAGASEHEATSTLSSSSPVTIPRMTAASDDGNDDEYDDDEAPPVRKKELRYGIRYFTPTVQVPLCGHATLAAAAVLYQNEPALLLANNTRNQTSIVFHAPQDVLRANQGSSLRTSLTRITMEFPTKPPSEIENDDEAVAANATHILEQAFGIDAQHILYLGISDIGDLLVELTQDCFLTLQVKDINALKEWNGYTRGVCVCCQNNMPLPPEEVDATTAATDDTGSQYGGSRGGGGNPEMEVDFFSRFFAPKAGIAEDPVTGSAHCVLAPYFASKLQKDRVVGFQRSKRGGIVECQLMENDRVKITGSACTIMSGSLWLKRSHLL